MKLRHCVTPFVHDSSSNDLFFLGASIFLSLNCSILHCHGGICLQNKAALDRFKENQQFGWTNEYWLFYFLLKMSTFEINLFPARPLQILGQCGLKDWNQVVLFKWIKTRAWGNILQEMDSVNRSMLRCKTAVQGFTEADDVQHIILFFLLTEKICFFHQIINKVAVLIHFFWVFIQ